MDRKVDHIVRGEGRIDGHAIENDGYQWTAVNTSILAQILQLVVG